MTYIGSVFCHVCDKECPPVSQLREHDRDLLRVDEWVSNEGKWYCPDCFENLRRCDWCGEENWEDDEWPEYGEWYLCPGCLKLAKEKYEDEISQFEKAEPDFESDDKEV